MPRLLLDTCALIWIAQDRSRLSPDVQARLSAGLQEAPVASAISAFEVAVKWRKRRLTLPLEPVAWFRDVTRQYGIDVEPVTWEDAVRAVLLPAHHNDPADRIIIATAERLGASVVTPDHLIRQYAEVQTIW